MSSRMAAGRKEGWGSQPHTHTNTISYFFFIQPELPCEQTQNTKKKKKKTHKKKNPKERRKNNKERNPSV